MSAKKAAIDQQLPLQFEETLNLPEEHACSAHKARDGNSTNTVLASVGIFVCD